MCDEIIYVIYTVLAKVPIDFDNKKVRYKMDCYILHTVFLSIILPFIIAIICYHYAKIGQN